MKVYVWTTIARNFKSQDLARRHAVQLKVVSPEGRYRVSRGRSIYAKTGFYHLWDVQERVLSYEFFAEGKALQKMIPAWAKCKAPKSLGKQVTKFYQQQATVCVA